jgi:thioredoxin 1
MGGISITKDTFDTEVLQSPIPVLIEFWAEWCGPCKMLSPFLDELAEEYAGRIKIAKINADVEADLAGQHNVVSVPTMVVYKDGQIQRQKSGAMPKREIAGFFKDFL